ncbi:MAG: hypothetical protein H5U40_15440, partial [Polyangiaceae bacterium]|nr:hypothetical protein [Polyangiaceae bacterium]
MAVLLASVLFTTPAFASSVGITPLRGPNAEAVHSALAEAIRQLGHEVRDWPADGTETADRPEFLIGGRVRRSGAALVADLTVEPVDAPTRRLRMRGANAEQVAERVARFLERRVRGFEAVEPEPTPEEPAPVDE